MRSRYGGTGLEKSTRNRQTLVVVRRDRGRSRLWPARAAGGRFREHHRADAAAGSRRQGGDRHHHQRQVARADRGSAGGRGQSVLGAGGQSPGRFRLHLHRVGQGWQLAARRAVPWFGHPAGHPEEQHGEHHHQHEPGGARGAIRQSRAAARRGHGIVVPGRLR